jgi:histone acetyltransferase (RNA polymerase elongator complex component)
MEQIIVFTGLNGNVNLCAPSNELPIETVLTKDCPAGAIIFNRNDLPNDDWDFFNSWELVNNNVLVNINKAREQTKERLREERIPLLAAQDVLYMQAIEKNQNTTSIVVEKQRLRDLPTLADVCTTLAQLRNLKP